MRDGDVPGWFSWCSVQLLISGLWVWASHWVERLLTNKVFFKKFKNQGWISSITTMWGLFFLFWTPFQPPATFPFFCSFSHPNFSKELSTHPLDPPPFHSLTSTSARAWPSSPFLSSLHTLSQEDLSIPTAVSSIICKCLENVSPTWVTTELCTDAHWISPLGCLTSILDFIFQNDLVIFPLP